MVRRLPCNWKRMDDGDLIETVKYAPVDPMRRIGCGGEVRSWRLASRGIASLGNRRGVMTVFAYLILCLPPPRLRRHRFLLVSWREDTEKRGRRRRKEKEKKEELLTAPVIVVDPPRWPVTSVPETRSLAPSRVACGGRTASSSGEDTFRHCPRSSVPAFYFVVFMMIPTWW